MKVLVFEDENALALKLCDILNKVRPGIEIMGIAPSVEAAKAMLETYDNIDVIFSDIRLEDGLSFSIFDGVDINAMVVFTTAFDEYALMAFDYNCVDYLLKPISVESVAKALDKYDRIKFGQSGVDISRAVMEYCTHSVKYRNGICMEINDSIHLCDINDVAYIEADNGGIRVHLKDGKWGSVDYSLTSIEKTLSPQIFIRVNRQMLVNVNSINKITRRIDRNYDVTLKPPYESLSIKITPEIKNQVVQIFSWSKM